MAVWKDDVHRPLTVLIFSENSEDGQRVLLEKWSVTYDMESARHLPVNGSQLGASSSSRDVIQQLKEVCKKIGVLLRALFSFMRQLPAHRLYRESYHSSLSYSIVANNNDDAALFDRDVATHSHSFLPIETPFGFLTLSTVYRAYCDQIMHERRSEAPTPMIFSDNVIIQDYVPTSPELAARNQTLLQDALQQAMDHDDLLSSSDRRRRSTPDHFVEATPAKSRTQSISQPMAIPHAKASTVYEENTLSPKANQKVIQHAHSYGDPERLRTLTTNPHIAPAPYGYGNVAIESSSASPSPTPELWSNSDESSQMTSRHSFSPAHNADEAVNMHPLSTPPRHPNSLTSLKNSRLFMTNSGHRRSISDQQQQQQQQNSYRSSLENFSLDGGPPHQQQSPSSRPAVNPSRVQTLHFGTTRRTSATRGYSVEESVEHLPTKTGSSPSMTPPFTYADAPMQSKRSAAPQIMHEVSTVSNPRSTREFGNVPSFSSSPPFHANPCELLSTSPGYSYSKQIPWYNKDTRHLPTFATTDQGQFRRRGSSSGSNPEGSPDSANTRQNKLRAFSTEFLDSSAGIWGVSPDTPDAFGQGFADSNGSNRQRLLSFSSGADIGSSSSQYEGDSDLMLPFAMGDMETLSTTATVTTTGSESSRPSFDGSTTSDGVAVKRASWDTASVGNFLHQLKHAPRLHTATGNTGEPVAQQDPKTQITSEAVPESPFDDELEGFRHLRDELASIM